VLNVLQQWVDPSDPLNFARSLAAETLVPRVTRPVFQTYGLSDSYSPAATMQAFVLAGGFTWVENAGVTGEPIGALKAVRAPLSLSGNLGGVAFGVRQYDPGAEDGHFVSFLVPQANADVVRFLAMAANGDTPAIGE
jgi:hypothetical protein